jgi:hypothetical protein
MHSAKRSEDDIIKWTMVKEKKDDSPHGKVVNYKSQKHYL